MAILDLSFKAGYAERLKPSTGALMKKVEELDENCATMGLPY